MVRAMPGALGVERHDDRVRLLAAAAVLRAGRVLVIREEDEPYRKSWVLPQGYPRPAEPLALAARREVAEEVGLEVQVERLLGVYEDFAGAPPDLPTHWVFVCYVCRTINEAPPQPSREAIDFAWVRPPAGELVAPPATRQMLADLR